MDEYVTKQELSEFKKEVRAKFECFQSENTDVKIWQSKYGTKIENIDEKVNELTDSLKEVLSKPQHRWDTVVSSAISAVVGGGVGAIIATVFNGMS